MSTTINGTTGIDKIQDGTITNADINASAAIAASKLSGTGKVLQVVHAQQSAPLSISASGSTTIVSASITPSATTSKILVMCNMTWSGTNPNAAFFLNRGGSELNPQVRFTGSWAWADDVTGGFMDLDEQAGSTWDFSDHSVQTIDAPSTTASTTYTLGVYKGDANNIAIGRLAANSAYGGKASSIILMEIGA